MNWLIQFDATKLLSKLSLKVAMMSVVAVSWFLPVSSHAAAALGAYNVQPSTVTVGGISSGAFMAVQLHVAYSASMHGAAIIAGGPFYCAQGSVSNATGYCQSGSGIPLSTLYSYTDNQASAGTIDATSNIKNSPVYMFSGTNDTTVHQAVMNALQTYYQHYNVTNITYNNNTAAQHAWISPDGPNGCNTSYSPYINNCSNDVEQTFLTKFYGTLNARKTGTLGGSYIQFDQNAFCPNSNCSAISMDSTGWVYVPANCANGQACKLMMAIHGCLQGQQFIQQQYVQKSGINEWADTNNIIVIYPQVIASFGSPYNPNGCWDWWGYTGTNYALKAGKQMTALKAMINKITSGAH